MFNLHVPEGTIIPSVEDCFDNRNGVIGNSINFYIDVYNRNFDTITLVIEDSSYDQYSVIFFQAYFYYNQGSKQHKITINDQDKLDILFNKLINIL